MDSILSDPGSLQRLYDTLALSLACVLVAVPCLVALLYLLLLWLERVSFPRRRVARSSKTAEVPFQAMPKPPLFESVVASGRGAV